jgi:hypothetical protein
MKGLNKKDIIHCLYIGNSKGFVSFLIAFIVIQFTWGGNVLLVFPSYCKMMTK